MRKAVYAGSFDCYTNGHHDIVRRASELFDEVHILIADNYEKARFFPAEDMKSVIEKSLLLDGIGNCIVMVCSGLVAEYAVNHEIKYLVRGLRNEVDYQYEEFIAQTNRIISSQLETVYLRTNNAAISSSMVRELLRFGKPVTSFVPEPMSEHLIKSTHTTHT